MDDSTYSAITHLTAFALESRSESAHIARIEAGSRRALEAAAAFHAIALEAFAALEAAEAALQACKAADEAAFTQLVESSFESLLQSHTPYSGKLKGE